MLNVHVHWSNKPIIHICTMLGEISSPSGMCMVCVRLCEREERSDHAATIKSSPLKKVAVNSEIEIELFIKYIH